MLPILPALIPLADKLVDHFFPNTEEREAKKQEMTILLARMERDGELQELETRMSAIVAEAQSKDPWTSRARPTFLYVVYLMILMAIPCALLGIWYPVEVVAFMENLKLYFNALPEEMYVLFGLGYLGYSHYRSKDKELIKKNWTR